MDTITNAQIPECMSEVVGLWAVVVQDAMPAEARDSARWEALLSRAASTGRKHEKTRLALAIDWMWSAVLPALQSTADEHGFGAQWRQMVVERTADAAEKAAAAAWATRLSSPEETAAAQAGWSGWTVATWAVVVEYTAAKARTTKARAAVARSVARAAVATEWTKPGAWAQFDPCTLLERLVAVSAS